MITVSNRSARPFIAPLLCACDNGSLAAAWLGGPRRQLRRQGHCQAGCASRSAALFDPCAFLVLELGAEGGELVGGHSDHGLEELLLADRTLVRPRVDQPGEVLAERADAGEVTLRDHAPQRTEAARISGGKLAGRNTRWRRLD